MGAHHGDGKSSAVSAGRLRARRPFLFPLQIGSSAAMAIMARRHPSVFERLSDLGAPTFLIEPRELPFGFLLRVGASRPRIEVVADPSAEQATARICGSLAALIELLEGRLDGDALFFSRELLVEGNTEAIVALRNAVDGAGVDVVADLLSVLGPLSGPAQTVARAAGSAAGRVFHLVDVVRHIAMAPVARRLDGFADRLGNMERRIAALESDAGRGRRTSR